MKKIISLLLVAVMCLSLIACGSGETPNTNDNNNTNPSEQMNNESTTDTTDSTAGNTEIDDTETEIPLIVIDFFGGPCINYLRFPECVEAVELTTDNWKDYIKVYSYSDKTTTYYQLGAGNERYHQFDGVSIELKHISTGEVISYKFDFDGEKGVPEDLNLDNYECVSIQGYLYFVDVPNEAITFPNEGFEEYYGLFRVGKEEYPSDGCGILLGTNAIDGSRISFILENWN